MDNPIQILILEDRASDADLIEYELINAGFPFISKRTTNGQAFLKALEEPPPPDLILSDYDLPQYTGAMAFVEAKRIFPKVPFILVSGALDENEGVFQEILAAGASGYISKDKLEELAPAVRRVLGFGLAN